MVCNSESEEAAVRCHLWPRGKTSSLEVALGCLRIQAEVQGCVARVEAAAICVEGSHSFSGITGPRAVPLHVVHGGKSPERET